MKPLQYTIIRRKRRKTASIIIKPDKTVHVVAPAFLKDSEIAILIGKKMRWISKKLVELEENSRNCVEHLFENGESFQFIGKQYCLTLLEGEGDASLQANNIMVPVPARLAQSIRAEYIKTALQHWYAESAREFLVEKTTRIGSRLGLHPSLISIKDYKSRWGCCFSDGRIYFNWRIIMAPEPIIDYVIVHELCHLAEHNHSKNYWQIVEKIVPDWKHRRKWLKNNGCSLRL